MNEDNELPGEFEESGPAKKSILTGAGVYTPEISSGSSGKKSLLTLVVLLAIGGIGGGYFYLSGIEGESVATPAMRAALVTPPPAPVGETPPAPSLAGTAPAQTPVNVPGTPSPEVMASVASAVTGGTPAATAPAAGDPAPAQQTAPAAPAAQEIQVPAPEAASITVPAMPVIEAPVLKSNASSLPEAALTEAAPPATALQQPAAPVPVNGVQPATQNTQASEAPTAAEMAIVQNAAAIDSQHSPLPAPKAADKTLESPGTGPRVSEILSQPANIRPLPERYLIVKKDHDADDIDSRLTAARTALAQGRNGAALELFNDLYEKNPKDKRVLMGRAVTMQKLGQTTDALAAYEEALNSDPKNIEALTNMLGILKDSGRGSAVEKLLQLRDVYPYNADITAQLGMVYGSAGEYEKSLKYLEMADALKPGNSNILYNRAVAYDRMGQSQKAADLYRQIVLLAGEEDIAARSFPIEAIKKRLANIH